LDREKRQARLMMLPLLMAERDLQYLEKVRKSRLLEEKIMSGVEGWRVGERTYHSDRFVKDTVFITE
jgi:NADH dehydrogenase (ubiquinone) 1 alpha subcomplex subunit 13